MNNAYRKIAKAHHDLYGRDGRGTWGLRGSTAHWPASTKHAVRVRGRRAKRREAAEALRAAEGD